MPHCDSRSAFRQAGVRKALTGAWHGIRGAVLARLGKTHTVPVLMVYGAQDQGISLADVEATAQRIPLVETCCFAGDHFDVYDGGDCQQHVVARQVGFLGRYLGG